MTSFNSLSQLAIVLVVHFCVLASAEDDTFSDPSRLVPNDPVHFSGSCQQTTPQGANCAIGAVDLVFVLDESGSIGSTDYNHALNFLADLTNALSIGPSLNQSNVGMVLFESVGQVYFQLNRYTSNSQVANAIRSAPYGGGGTCIACGMNTATNNVFVAPGDRPSVSNVMIVLTDGQDSSDVTGAHNSAVAKHVDIYAIGVGSNVDMQQLTAVTGDPNKVFTISNFVSLQCILQQVCQQIATSHVVTTTTTTMPPPPPNVPRPCACNVSNTWLDIVIAIDASAANKPGDFSALKADLYSYIYSVHVGQDSGNNGVRLGVIYYADTVTVLANLTTYTSTSQAALGVLTIPFLNNQFGDAPGNIACALRTAEELLFENGGNRAEVPDVLIYVSPTSVNCTYPPQTRSVGQNTSCGDPCPLLDRLQNRGVTVVTIAALKNDPRPPLPSSPCFSLANGPTLNPMLTPTMCKANCFCNVAGYHNFYQFTTPDCTFYGECVTPVITPNNFLQADAACAVTNKHFVADVFSAQKEQLLRSLALQTFEVPDFWIGLNDRDGTGHYSWTRGPAGFGKPAIPARSTDYKNWGPGEPNDANGRCVLDMQHNGFQRAWFKNRCFNMQLSKPYFCQKNACDTDNHSCR